MWLIRQNKLGIFIVAMFGYIGLNFLYSFLINLNDGEKKLADIIMEVKQLGYPSNDFELKKFNIINGIGGGRSLYSKYVFNKLQKLELNNFYRESLKKNGWNKDNEKFKKNDIVLQIKIERNIVVWCVNKS
jgi:hypothetical protein